MIRHTPANLAEIRRAAEMIQGTCRGIDDVLQEVFGADAVTVDDMDAELLAELDSLVLECECCGWWCETSELNEDQTCEDCQ